MGARRRNRGPGPFEGLRAAAGVEHARWAIDEVGDPFTSRLGVPHGFDAYLRILHPRRDERSWAEAHPQALHVDGPELDVIGQVDDAGSGDLDPHLVDRLVELLARHTSTPERCHYGLWVGWGQFHHRSSTRLYSWDRRWPRWVQRRAERRLEDERRRELEPIEALLDRAPVAHRSGGHDVHLLDGPIGAVAAIGTPWADGTLDRQSPQWWWPEDRGWFVSTGIDDLWTHLGGARDLIHEVLADDRIEAVEVPVDARW